MSAMHHEIYTDGACKGNGGANSRGGYAFTHIFNNTMVYSRAKAVEDTTNQRMELSAVIAALDYLFNNFRLFPEDTVTIYSDSAYVINCMHEKWYVKWAQNGWVNSKKEPVANQDLWKKLLTYANDSRITFMKVKGHAGDKYNEIVDRLAQGAAGGNDVSSNYTGL